MSNTDETLTIPSRLPVLALRDVVVFPYMIIPLVVGRDMSTQAIEAALSGDRLIAVVTQREVDVENPAPEDLYAVGTVCNIMRMVKLSEDRVKILVQGVTRARLHDYETGRPYLFGGVEIINESPSTADDIEREAQMRSIVEDLQRIATVGKSIPMEVVDVAENVTDAGRLADIAGSNLNLKLPDAQTILETLDVNDRIDLVRAHLVRELALIDAQARIEDKAREGIHKTQREYFLREQLKAIRKELGDSDDKDDEIDLLQEKIDKAKMPKDVKSEAEKQLKRLARMHGDSAEANVLRTYLDHLIELPWSKKTKDKLELATAREILDADHYGLDKVKERILEFLAVARLKGSVKGSILCFVGPPGVGKTSLGRSIAEAMGRKFVRVSLGGVRDEAEIRGHRRTYVGAMPGKIISGVKQAGSTNPVFMLDELDKLGSDFRGDPSSALLEVLDPEQNDKFVDHYLGVAYDLSDTLFIATANMEDAIPRPLHDRMEMIRIPGYTLQEKAVIAQRYLVPRQMHAAGLKDGQIEIPRDVLELLIDNYTREAGVRTLERTIGSVCRKVARRVLEENAEKIVVTARDLEEMLGAAIYVREEDETEDLRVGLATGLAWTPVGGEILHIEAQTVRGRGGLTLTGHLGDVMRESAQAAVTFARSRAKALGIKDDFFATNDIHMHVPAGAIPKDGPSAGVAMITALASALTGKPSTKGVAMTGEITLRGRVLPIGGLREKVLAAHRAGITHVIAPEGNRKDLKDIAEDVRKTVEMHFVESIDQVLEISLGIDTHATPAAKAKGKKSRAKKAGKSSAASHGATGRVAAKSSSAND